eukprot:COSAG01_NODE_5539_length_4199_cov_2.221220_5_plen_79_part_00
MRHQVWRRLLSVCSQPARPVSAQLPLVFEVVGTNTEVRYVVRLIWLIRYGRHHRLLLGQTCLVRPHHCSMTCLLITVG